jgi:hypothetical protein
LRAQADQTGGTYTWSENSSPDDAVATFDPVNGADTEFSADTPGAYTVRIDYENDQGVEAEGDVSGDLVVLEADVLTVTDNSDPDNKVEDDTGDHDADTLYVSPDWDGIAIINIDFSWLPEDAQAEDVGEKFLWKIVKIDGNEVENWQDANGNFVQRPTNSVWIEPDDPENAVDREFEVQVGYDEDGNGELDTDECKRSVYVIVLEPVLEEDVLTVADSNNPDNKVEDTTPEDATPEDNMLIIVPGEDGTAEISIGLTWWPEDADAEEVGPKFLWKILKKGGGEVENWQDANGNFVQRPTNSVWIEPDDPENAVDREFEIRAGYDEDGNGELSEDEYERLVCVAVVRNDLDIDSENHWGEDYFTTDFRTGDADDIEDEVGEDKSKVVFVNDIDRDADEVPDFMDGWGCPVSQIPALPREISGKRDSSSDSQFVPLIWELGIRASVADKVRVKFVYPESPPSSMGSESESWTVTQNSESKSEDATWIASDEGKIRIWQKDGSEERSVEDDYVESDKTYALAELGLGDDDTEKTFYVEGINASADWSDIEIKVMVSLDEGSTWASEDTVRASCLRCNFTMEVVTQYYRTLLLGNRKRFVPDYTSIFARLDGVWDAEKADGTYHKTHGTSEDEDKDWWWHEPDAVLGHGFVCFQYEGPDLGNALSEACEASDYQAKYFWGKTGGGAFTFWDYDPFGHENDQSDLAWWDVCEYELQDDKMLVLRKTYTLHYEMLSDLYDTFDDVPGRYEKFGLHIDLDEKGWGCLSNVGLAMDDHDIDNTRMDNTRVTKRMPTTANRSVWRVVMGTHTSYGAGSDELKHVFDTVKDHCEGVAWGASVPNTGDGTLGDGLLGILQGKTLRDENLAQWEIAVEADLQLDMDIDDLDYYDPGLIPAEFGENPEDVFDAEE